MSALQLTGGLNTGYQGLLYNYLSIFKGEVWCGYWLSGPVNSYKNSPCKRVYCLRKTWINILAMLSAVATSSSPVNCANQST